MEKEKENKHFPRICLVTEREGKKSEWYTSISLIYLACKGKGNEKKYVYFFTFMSTWIW